MKVRCISHNDQQYLRETAKDLPRLQRQVSDDLPFATATGYVRAMNAAKLEKMHAKPFVSALSEHIDGVTRLSAHTRRPSLMLSGSFDGQVKLWDLSAASSLLTVQAHSCAVAGLAWCVHDDARDQFLSAGADGRLRLWRAVEGPATWTAELVREWQNDGAVTDLSAGWGAVPRFLTVGTHATIWDMDRSEPVSSFAAPGGHSFTAGAFCPSQPNLYVLAGGDCTIGLYDAELVAGRAAGGKVAGIQLDARTNRLAFNPREPHLFLAAGDDSKVREFDVRTLTRAVCVYKDHVAPVTDVAWSFTGREFASGGYDECVRLWPRGRGRSRDCYHTKRMEKVLAISVTCDSHFCVTGSRDGSLRVWKMDANYHMAPVSSRQRLAENARRQLIANYAHMPGVDRIVKSGKKLIPKHVQSRTRRYGEAEVAAKRHLTNRVAAGNASFVAERARGIRQDTAE